MDVVQLTKELINIDSSTQEMEMAKAIQEYLKDLGLNSELTVFRKGRANLIAEIGKGKGDLMLNGHMDTVSIGDSKQWEYGTGAVVRRGRLYGRGASDMKGGIASILVALANIDLEKLNKKLLLVFVGGEETSFDGSMWLLDNRRKIFKGIKYGVIAEPTNMKLQLAQKGLIEIILRFKGRSAHGSEPWLGDNAVLKAAQFITEFDRFSKATRIKDKVLGNGTVNVGVIKGGIASNIVPEYCEVQIDRRIAFGESRQEAINQVRTVLKKLGFKPEIELKAAKDPFKIDKDSKIFQIMSSITSQRGFSTTIYTEAELYYKEAGIECLVYGPGNTESIHASNEYVSLGNLKKAARVYEALISKWCF